MNDLIGSLGKITRLLIAFMYGTNTARKSVERSAFSRVPEKNCTRCKKEKVCAFDLANFAKSFNRRENVV